MEDLPVEHVEELLGVYALRYKVHSTDGHVMIFCNHGEHAGASLTHPHSQVVVIPRQITLDTLIREPFNNIVEDNSSFITYCPDFSQWPYEVWIAPKKQDEATFADLSQRDLSHLASLLKESLRRLRKKYDDPATAKIHQSSPFAYNYYIHHGKNWFLRIIPRLVHRAGFELGTGLSINVVDPYTSAQELKRI